MLSGQIKIVDLHNETHFSSPGKQFSLAVKILIDSFHLFGAFVEGFFLALLIRF
jgi:hypothetical protein